MIDIVFPNNNEEEFIQTAKALGIKGLIFAYPDKSRFYTKQAHLPIQNAIITLPSNIKKGQNHITICKGSREAIERGASIAFDFEQQEAKDKTHYRESGLNQVLCKMATEKNVAIGFSFSSVLVVAGQSRAQLLGRFAQNITLCAKYKTPTKIASFAKEPMQMRAPAELTVFFTQMGMHASAAKKSLN